MGETEQARLLAGGTLTASGASELLATMLLPRYYPCIPSP